MRARLALLLSVFLLTGPIAAAPQPLSCASVAPEVRERVREVGACRDAVSGDVALKGAALTSSSTVTMTLSDGTVVRIPRDISSNINDGRKRAATDEDAPQPKRAPRARASAASKPGASGARVAQVQKLEVPAVVGRSYVDAGSALAEFKVDRIETASATPAGEVLAQEPAPATRMLRGSTVRLQVSDGSLAGAAGANPVTAPVAAAGVAPAAAVAPAPATEPIVQPSPRGRFPIAFPANAALILGAGVLLGVLVGGLLMHQWQLRRKLAADEKIALPPALYRHQQPLGTDAGGFETEAMPEIRFAARLDPGETTIELVSLDDTETVASEHSSDQHA